MGLVNVAEDVPERPPARDPLIELVEEAGRLTDPSIQEDVTHQYEFCAEIPMRENYAGRPIKGWYNTSAFSRTNKGKEGIYKIIRLYRLKIQD